MFGSGLVIAPLIENFLVHHHATCRLVAGSEIVVQVSQPSGGCLDAFEVGRGGAESLFCGGQLTATFPAVSPIGVVEATPGVGYRAASISRSALGRDEGRSMRFVRGGGAVKCCGELVQHVPALCAVTDRCSRLGELFVCRRGDGGELRRDLTARCRCRLSGCVRGWAVVTLSARDCRWVTAGMSARSMTRTAPTNPGAPPSSMSRSNTATTRSASIVRSISMAGHSRVNS